MVVRPKTNINLVAQIVSKFLDHLDVVEGIDRSISAISAEAKAGPYEGIETRDAEEEKLVKAIANSDFSEVDADVYEHAGFWALPDNSKMFEGIDDSEFINYFEDDTFEHFLLRNAFLRARLETIRKEKAKDIADFSYTARDPLFQDNGPENIQRVLMRDYGKLEGLFHNAFDDEDRSSEATEMSTTVKPGAHVLKVHERTDRNGACPSISEVFESWRDFGDPAETTVKDYRTQIRRFIEIFGDLPVDRITVSDVHRFRNIISQLPARQNGQQRSMGILELVKSIEGNSDIKRLSPKTVKEKALAAISSILSHAKSEALIPSNVASGLQVKKDKAQSAKVPRLPFKAEHLQAILNSGVYQRRDIPYGGKGPAAFWIPMISMFSGARRGEIAGLRVDDVREEDGVVYFFIQYHEDRRTKTISSVRKIPVHSKLREFGFLDYVARQKRLKHERLFHLLPINKIETGKPWGAWFNRYLRTKIGITDKRYSFHSYRHTFKRKLENNKLDRHVVDSLLGHSSGSVGDGYGLDEDAIGYELPVLQEALEKLEFPELDFSKIKLPKFD